VRSQQHCGAGAPQAVEAKQGSRADQGILGGQRLIQRQDVGGREVERLAERNQAARRSGLDFA
jgi:hypothetical protein